MSVHFTKNQRHFFQSQLLFHVEFLKNVHEQYYVVMILLISFDPLPCIVNDKII